MINAAGRDTKHTEHLLFVPVNSHRPNECLITALAELDIGYLSASSSP